MIVLRRAAAAALFRKDAAFEIYLDRRATADAALLILGLAGIGYLWAVFQEERGFSVWTLMLVMVNSLMLWIVRAGVCLLVGKIFFRIDPKMSTIMRLQGFAYLPLALTFLPASIGIVGIVWFLAVLVFATAEAMELVWWQSAVTVAVSVVGLFLISPFFWGGYRVV